MIVFFFIIIIIITTTIVISTEIYASARSDIVFSRLLSDEKDLYSTVLVLGLFPALFNMHAALALTNSDVGCRVCDIAFMSLSTNIS